MLEIRYSEPNELEISGSAGELQSVRRKILELVDSEKSQISFNADVSIDPEPYDSALSKLVIVKGHFSASVSLRGGADVYVEGSVDCLEGFASFLDFDAEDQSGTHSHFEYFEGNDWISSDSVPLVISVK